MYAKDRDGKNLLLLRDSILRAGKNTVTLKDGYATINHNCGFSGTNYAFMIMSTGSSRRIPIFVRPLNGDNAEISLLDWNTDGTIKDKISDTITINWIAVAF